MERIEIYSSKKKSFLLLILSLLFVTGGIWFFIDSENLANFRYKSPIFIKAIGIISILLFGMALFTAIKQLVKNRLLILIDENGINVNPKKTPAQNIEWNNVEAFSELKIQSQKMVVIEVNNPEYWIKNENNAIKRKLIEYNFNNYGSPIVVSAGSMQINHAELVKILNENLEKYKN
ncbi:STM3941 family protein [Flavobacterium tructae]|uniref:Uncharacterized protein n=2 Tax=Flavobacterium tructae TaxID=1114873 RepID=A0A1S1JBA7_9FLAO|nr:STM3941 family protein [Flavobacterium tructae]OHT46854.1 hypothetical protein BHE19_04950 [Flavobacterium tructae]OXB21161.1 hypothetical protein B0A71_06130 [Flavobacterium tructae]